jgi:hypothetical protein
MRTQALHALWLALFAVGSASASEPPAPPKFVKAPAAAKTAGGGVRIEFAVNRKTDVAVYILNARGKIARHLVAGVLGQKAPAPLKPGLSQSLEWDGKGDDGKPAAGGPFKVRVALGLKTEFDKYLFHNRDAVPNLMHIAAAPKGELYVFYRDNVGNPNMGGYKVKAFGRDGRHRRMVFPFSSQVPYEKVGNMGAMRDDQGRLVPEIHSWASMRFHPSVLGAGRGIARKSLPAVDSKGTAHWMLSGGVLVSVAADGTSPYKSFLSKPAFDKSEGLSITDWYCKIDATLAVGEGDKYLYVSNLGSGKGKNVKPFPAIYRLDLVTRGKAQLFAGDPKKAGKSGKLLTAPSGIACAGGIVYVADSGAGRVVGFKEKDGSLAGEFKATKPSFVAASARNGAVYVIAGDGSLVKFDSIRSGKEVCRLKLPRSRGKYLIALDDSQKTARIWTTIKPRRSNTVCCVDDTGNKLQIQEDVSIQYDASGFGAKQMSFDLRRGELVYQQQGQYYRMNEETGKTEAIKFSKSRTVGNSSQVVTCADGSLISHGNSRGLWRWTRDGKPLPWKGAPGNDSKHTGVTTTAMVLGPVDNMAVFKDQIYVNPPGNWRLMSPKSGGAGPITSLNVHGMDGKVKRTAIWQCSVMAVPRVDLRGNIYLAEVVRPRGRMSPKFFDGKRDKSFVKGYDSHNYMYGSIVKFPPEGGAVWFQKGVNKHKKSGKLFTEGKMPAGLLKKPEIPVSYPSTYYKGLTDGTVQGAEWMRFGYAPYSAKLSGGKPVCCCENANFDVDGFGRVFYPNLGRFRVEMVDTNNNWLGMFGRYGNQDDVAKGEDIPMAWPTYMTVSDKYVYVTDLISLRTLRVKLAYAADRRCPVR